MACRTNSGTTSAHTPSMAIAEAIAASSASAFLEGQALYILVAAGEDHDEIDEGPDAATAEGDELDDADPDMSCVEAVDAEETEEETQQQGNQPLLVRYRPGLATNSVPVDGDAALDADDGLFIDFRTA